MTDPGTPAGHPQSAVPTPTGGFAYQVSMVARYLETNRDRYTEEALVQAARDRGYPDDVLEAARTRARASAASAPIRQRARRWILVAYLVTFAVLAIGMLVSESARRYGGSYIGTAILAITLGLAFLISVGWIRWQGRAADGQLMGLAIIVSVPLVLLVAVAGACLATGLPIPRPY